MSAMKQSGDDIMSEDLTQFVQVYLKSLLLYNPHPVNLLLPTDSQEDNPNIENVYELLTDIVNSADLSAAQSILSKQKTEFQICEEEKAPHLDEEEVRSQHNLLATVERLAVDKKEEAVFEEIMGKKQFCWG